MKVEIPIKLIVLRPLAGVTMNVQRGRDELLPPSRSSSAAAVFEFTVSADLSAAVPNFLGKYVQGPKGERFIYVNSGRQARQDETVWDRRAKVSLMTITRKQIDDIIGGDGLLLEAKFEGVGRDGGPACASVKGVTWRVSQK